jgi:hypothetical protein
MSFIALDICGGRFAKGCRIKGMILHALSGDASYLLISNIIAAERWDSSRNGVTHEYVQFRSAPVLRRFPAFSASVVCQRFAPAFSALIYFWILSRGPSFKRAEYPA